MQRHEVEASYTLIDIQQSFILVLIMILALIFTLVKLEQTATEAVKSPGDVIVQLYWQDKNVTDLDLWVEAPGDKPVGYSNTAGLFFNLLRDDLGGDFDITGLNEEVAFSRGLPDGEYTVNVHSYSPDTKGGYPVRAIIKVSARLGEYQTLTDIYSGEYTFTHGNDEHTFVRFTIKDRQWDRKYNSLVPRLLRSAK